MIARFKDRASAVKKRNLPPVAGEERERFIEQAENDYMDFSIIANSDADLSDGVLTLKIDLNQ